MAQMACRELGEEPHAVGSPIILAQAMVAQPDLQAQHR
jgi:hypothetical protein